MEVSRSVNGPVSSILALTRLTAEFIFLHLGEKSLILNALKCIACVSICGCISLIMSLPYVKFKAYKA